MIKKTDNSLKTLSDQMIAQNKKNDVKKRNQDTEKAFSQGRKDKLSLSKTAHLGFSKAKKTSLT